MGKGVALLIVSVVFVLLTIGGEYENGSYINV